MMVDVKRQAARRNGNLEENITLPVENYSKTDTTQVCSLVMPPIRNWVMYFCGAGGGQGDSPLHD